MSISVNKDICIGCGTCVSLCPDSFQIGEDGKSEVISQVDNECVHNAVVSCPVQAISIE